MLTLAQATVTLHPTSNRRPGVLAGKDPQQAQRAITVAHLGGKTPLRAIHALLDGLRTSRPPGADWTTWTMRHSHYSFCLQDVARIRERFAPGPGT